MRAWCLLALAGCGGGWETIEIEHEPELAITIESAFETPSRAGHRFAAIRAVIINRADQPPITVELSSFWLATVGGISFAPSAETDAMEVPCSSAVMIDRGAEWSCDVVFELPDARRPIALELLLPDGRSASAPY